MTMQSPNMRRPHQAAPTAPRRMTIGAVQQTAPKTGLRLLIYGTEGVGKSTWAAGAPAPVFLAPTKAVERLGVQAFPEPTSFGDVLDAVDELTTAEHEFQTLVIDELGWLEQLVFAWLCAKHDWPSIESPGYGKGYTAALEQWRVLLARLERLQTQRGTHVVFVGHAEVKRHDDPMLPQGFDRYRLIMHEKVSAMLRQWCEAVFFVRYELHTAELKGRVRAASNGARVVHTEWSPAFDAKNRFGLPSTLPLSWEDFEAARAEGALDDATPLLARIDELAGELKGHVDAKGLEASIKRAGKDPGKLKRLVDRLEARLAQTSQKGGE